MRVVVPPRETIFFLSGSVHRLTIMPKLKITLITL